MNFFQKIRAMPDALNGFLFADPNRNGEYRLLRNILQEGYDNN